MVLQTGTSNRTESRWFAAAITFLSCYVTLLFFIRMALLKLESESGSLLKPEPSQIIAIGLLIILYHFAFAGLYFFSLFGRWQKLVAIASSLLITLSLLYGFRQWYEAIVNNPFLSLSQPGNLPWYAAEKTKFLLANSPLILYFISVLVLRLTMMINPKQA